MKTFWKILIGIIVLLGIFSYVRFCYVYATGTKAGVLNTFQEKGYVFKTFEGKIIQSGFRANVQSNEFDFSVTDDKVAKILMENAGKEVNLHYKRYFGSLPWRGMSSYIVDSVYQIRGVAGETIITPK